MDTACLLVIDVQHDFCTGGALEVPGGEHVVPAINALSQRFAHTVATQDWHPPRHSSFASTHVNKQPYDSIELDYGNQILWPDHCVQGTHGGAFHADLNTDRFELVVRKGFRSHIDSYSAFYENDRTTATGLNGYLRSRDLTSLYLVGLATDFCVAYSAIDAAQAGFKVVVIEDACRGIDLNDSLVLMKKQMTQAGVQFMQSSDLPTTL